MPLIRSVRAWLLCLAALFALGARAESPLETAQQLPVIAEQAADNLQGVFFGLFRPGLITDIAEEAPLDLRRKPASLMWFSRFGSSFPESAARFLQQNDMVAHIAWEPWNAFGEGVSLAEIAAGKWDEYLDSYARDAARVDIPVILRWGHEMNGNWYPWALAKNDRKPDAYIQAFRHVVERFRKAGAHKVQFAWCINNDSVPNEPWNHLTASYPGDDYVDWVSIDGYNFGTSQTYSQWRSFEQTFRASYDAVTKIAPGKPILIGEMASSEAGGNKAAWIRDMFKALPSMPAIRALTWFDIVKETSWNVDSSDESWLAMIEGLRAPWVRSSGAAMAAVAARKPAKPD